MEKRSLVSYKVYMPYLICRCGINYLNKTIELDRKVADRETLEFYFSFLLININILFLVFG